MIETVLYAFWQSDRMGQAIVIVLLLVSAYAWCLMLHKISSLLEIRRHCNKLRQAFEQASYSPLSIANTLQQYQGPLKEVCEAGISELKKILQRDGSQGLSFRHCLLSRKLTDDEIDKIRSTMNRVVTTHSLRMQERMPTLGSIVSMSPMLGLFGTVWGVMLTFIGIARVGRPDLMAIAPGISGALLTTVAGLLVAMPSLVAYNSLVALQDAIEVSMDTFTEDFISSLRLEETKLPQSVRQEAEDE